MASGDTLVVFTPLQGEPPATVYATLDTVAATGDTPDSLPVFLRFDPTTDESMDFVGVMPEHYDGGGVTCTVIWTSDATSGTCIWELQFKSFTDGADALTKAYASAQSVTATKSGTTLQVDYDDVTFTDGAQMDSVAAGERFRLRVTRNGGTMSSNDGYLLGVHIKET